MVGLVCTLCFWCVLDSGGGWWLCYLGLVVRGLAWTAFFWVLYCDFYGGWLLIVVLVFLGFGLWCIIYSFVRDWLVGVIVCGCAGWFLVVVSWLWLLFWINLLIVHVNSVVLAAVFGSCGLVACLSLWFDY